MHKGDHEHLLLRATHLGGSAEHVTACCVCEFWLLAQGAVAGWFAVIIGLQVPLCGHCIQLPVCVPLA